MRFKYLIPLLTAFLLFTSISKGQFVSLGFHANVNEYMGDLSNNQPQFYQFKFIRAGAGISLQEYLSPSFNLIQAFNYDRVQYQTPNLSNAFDVAFYSLNFQLKYKFNNNYILPQKFPVAPFVLAGIGGTYINPVYTAPLTNPTKTSFTLGAGIDFRLSETVSLQVANILNFPLDDRWDGLVQGNNNDLYLQHSVGLIFTFKKGLDTDGDGVKDRRDDCPNTPLGTKVDNHGCPIVYVDEDKDGDGVPDSRDKCPRTPHGTQVDYFGCPVTVAKSQPAPPTYTQPTYTQPVITDTDGDGIADYMDRCPNTPRGTPVDAYGCPLDGDNDGDGVPNSKDRCPNTYGPASNMGCPIVKEETQKRLRYAMHNINFETNKYIITTNSYSILDEVVSILKEYPDYSLRMGGHTDDIGSAEYNLNLSQNRVEAAKAYLVSKGIAAERIEARGYGKNQPIATNSTIAGRAENRRVELNLFLK